MNNAMPIFDRSEFRKSTFSGQNPQACVEVARGGDWVAIRDSKQAWNSADDHRLVFTADQFDAWLAGVSSGSSDAGCIDITRRADGVHVLCSTVPQAHDNALTFDDAEIAAFLDGAREGEFASPARGVAA